jgi:hypothetical protein
MLIVNCVPDEPGWNPIQHLVALASRLLEAETITVPEYPRSFLRQLSLMIRRRRGGAARASETCLLICAGPSDIARVMSVSGWRGRFRYLAAWIIDSFWLEFIPKSVRLAKPFDHFFVTRQEDADDWRRITGVQTTWLPWGADALDLGSDGADRPWDLARLGRQPPEWDDDASNAQATRALGLRYHGRLPADGLTSLEVQRQVMGLYAASKYLLAFSNAANPTRWTHPTRQYLTGRWVDALAGGSTVAGVAPHGQDADRLLWPGATLELGGVQREDGLRVVSDALHSWTSAKAAHNNLMALERLDWRWRVKAIADTFGVGGATLNAEIERLTRTIGHRRAAAPQCDRPSSLQ